MAGLPSRIDAIGGRIRTPLVLAGLVVLVLYALYRQILSLAIFTTLSQEGTFRVVDLLIRVLFWLALLAIVLGVASGFVAQSKVANAEIG